MSMSYHHKRVCATIRVNGSNQAHTQSKPYFVMPAHCASVSASKRRSSSAVEIPVWHHLSVLCASCCGALQCACRAESRAPLERDDALRDVSDSVLRGAPWQAETHVESVAWRKGKHRTQAYGCARTHYHKNTNLGDVLG